MSFLALKFLLLTAVVAVTSVAADDDNLLTFLSIMSGRFTDAQELKEDELEHNSPHDAVTLDFKPVHVPALDPARTMLFEEADNGRVYRLQIVTVWDEDEDVIRIHIYNFTDITNMAPGSYDLNNLQSVTKDDLETLPECEAQLQRVEETVYMGTWPDCRSRGPSRVPAVYAETWTCNAVTGIATAASDETASPIPYVTRNTGVRYPLLPYMLGGRTDYVNPCDACGH